MQRKRERERERERAKKEWTKKEGPANWAKTFSIKVQITRRPVVAVQSFLEREEIVQDQTIGVCDR